MSNAKWCDIGNHAFSDLEEGWTQMSVSESYKDANGNYGQRALTLHACSVHKVSIASAEPGREAIAGTKNGVPQDE